MRSYNIKVNHNGSAVSDTERQTHRHTDRQPVTFRYMPLKKLKPKYTYDNNIKK